MKRKILSIILALTILFALGGCQNGNAVYHVYDDVTFIEVAYRDGFSIYVHAETRVMYISSISELKGLSIMLDSNGKPLIWEGEL